MPIRIWFLKTLFCDAGPIVSFLGEEERLKLILVLSVLMRLEREEVVVTEAASEAVVAGIGLVHVGLGVCEVTGRAGGLQWVAILELVVVVVGVVVARVVVVMLML
jgi:hypothetical protein